jgi:hypothetical protein
MHRRLDPDCVVNPSRSGSGPTAANGGEFSQHLAKRQSISVQSSVEKRPVTTGTRPTPSGQPPGSEVDIALLARQYFEIIGQELVYGCGAKEQAVIKRIHAISPIEDVVARQPSAWRLL